MKTSTIYLFIISVLLILFSPALGRIFIQLVYADAHLTSEYITMLSGSITAFLWLGIIAFAVGFVPFLIAKFK